MEKGKILYPCYFDAKLKRSEGRRVMTGDAVPTPGVQEIERALATCGVKYQREKKSHPGWWWKQEGRVIAEYDGLKSELIRNVASVLKTLQRKK
ncbi:MAG TPA: signal recognition particle subunit SRP19/SEC65 family protein [Methanospirillum sp.]|nr:signal recognition particle subunit SRP19/SEC65 family protein [Methanospirillum sp.]